MPLNGKFESKYGLAWKDMDHDSRLMAIMSELFDLRDTVQPMSEMCKIVEKHKTYWTIAIFFASAISLSLVGLFIKVVFGG